jgi:PilZ domain
MTEAMSFDPARLSSQRLVIPVRYMAEDEIQQTTSTAVGEEVIHVRAERPPKPGLIVGFKLYFERGQEVTREGIVSRVTAGTDSGFWTRFSQDGARDRVAALLARYRQGTDRVCRRFHTNMAATIRKDGRPQDHGEITNISQSGAFMKLAVLPALGSVVDLDIDIPGQTVPGSVQAWVVHVAPNRGVGLQFIGASDLFRADLEEYLSGLR